MKPQRPSFASQLSVDIFESDIAKSSTTTIIDDGEAIRQELLNELVRLDLSQNEAKIVVRLVSRGAAIASEISKDLSMPRTETYHYISSLIGRGIVLATFTKPRKYYSLSFDEVVDHLVQTKYNTLRSILQNKKDYQRKIDRISSAAANLSPAASEAEEDKSYQVIAGEDALITRVLRMLSYSSMSSNRGKEKEGELCGFLTERTLGMLYHGEALDKMMAIAEAGSKVEIKTTYGNTAKYFGVNRASHISLLIVKGETATTTTTTTTLAAQNPSEFIMFND
ncbi:MAG TPA: helix-turn-helix domain-containing protein, partial [Nitrososphaera sp.]|nr:helix-turn-helix domain-containing protein [Nitrososphaera sp.]